jgi:hypothetical protein
MSFSSASGHVRRGTSGAEVSSRPDTPTGDGAYLTDGRTLFRVAAPLHWTEGHEFALLEDCTTLEVFAFTADELWDAALKALPTRRGE